MYDSIVTDRGVNDDGGEASAGDADLIAIHDAPLEPAEVLALGAAAQIATIEWDGGGDGMSWHDAANWDTEAVPDAMDNVAIGAHDVEIDADATATIKLKRPSGSSVEHVATVIKASEGRIMHATVDGDLSELGVYDCQVELDQPGRGTLTNSHKEAFVVYPVI